jgi:hypothetical protein
MTRRFGAEATAEWADFERAAVDRVRDNLNRYAIDAEPGPEGELCLAHSPRAARRLAADAGPGEEWLPPPALTERGLSAAGTHGGLLRPLGFPIHPLSYVRGLARRRRRMPGVRLHGDTPVTALSRAGGDWLLRTEGGRVAARKRPDRHQRLHRRRPAALPGGPHLAGPLGDPRHPPANRTRTRRAELVEPDHGLRLAPRAALLPAPALRAVPLRRPRRAVGRARGARRLPHHAARRFRRHVPRLRRCGDRATGRASSA